MINGKVGGQLRLACQVTVSGNVVVHTRPGGPPVQPRQGEWAASTEPSKWKERWEKRNESKGGDTDDAAAAE